MNLEKDEKDEKEENDEKSDEKGKNLKNESKAVYNPKKQCYCYVYSIKHKFGVDYEKIVEG